MADRLGGFAKLLLQSVDEGLAKVLGEDTAKAMKFYIDPMIATKEPDRFIHGVRKIFGSGAETIEGRILDSLCSKIGLSITDKQYRDFSEYVEEARRKYVERILAQQELVTL